MADPIAKPDAHHGLARLAVIALAIFQILTPMLPLVGIGDAIGSRSDNVRTVITPAGWAFAIWGPLYTGSLVFALYQALPAQRSSALVARLRWPAAGAFLGNALWAAYVQVYGLSFVSVAIILFTLGCLLRIYQTFSIWPASLTRGERWCAVLPLSALASWLTVATIVNIAAALRFHGVDAGEAGPAIGAVVILVGGAIASIALVRGGGNPPFALVFLWALGAIFAAGGRMSELIAGAVALAATMVFVGTALGLRRAGVARWFGQARLTKASQAED